MEKKRNRRMNPFRKVYEGLFNGEVLFLLVHFCGIPLCIVFLAAIGVLSFSVMGVLCGISGTVGLLFFTAPKIWVSMVSGKEQKLNKRFLDPNITPKELSKLAASKFATVREKAIKHPLTPINIILPLMNAGGNGGRQATDAVFLHKDTPTEVIINLFHGNGQPYISADVLWDFVADDTKLNASQIKEIVTTTCSSPVKRSLAYHRNLDFNTMVILLQDKDAHVRRHMYGVIRGMHSTKFLSLVQSSDYSYLAGLPKEWVVKSVGFDKHSFPEVLLEDTYA